MSIRVRAACYFLWKRLHLACYPLGTMASSVRSNTPLTGHAHHDRYAVACGRLALERDAQRVPAPAAAALAAEAALTTFAPAASL
jgi:hypothetical protein